MSNKCYFSFVRVYDLDLYFFAFLFNLVSSTGLHLPTIYFVQLCLQSCTAHTFAYDQLLADILSLLKSILTFSRFKSFPPTHSCDDSLLDASIFVFFCCYGK